MMILTLPRCWRIVSGLRLWHRDRQDGVQALELVEQEAPHLMLLDLDMPTPDRS